MDGSWLTVELRDPGWIVLALAAGLGARALRLPSLVGFLVAGFVIHALGATSGELLDEIADVGIILLLFTVGLRLDLRLLARREVWAVGVIQLVAATAVFSGLVWALTFTRLGPLDDLDRSTCVVLGLAVSFSSTVFAVKVLGDRGATMTHHGRIAIGILVLQDVAAVAFLAVSGASWPSPWAVLLLAIIPLRQPLRLILKGSGHGELMVLFGVAAALGGAALFDAVGISGDLGALIMGMVLAGGGKVDELNKALMGLKDLFLVGFFLSIGMAAMPDLGGIAVAGILVLLIPLKTAIYLLTFSGFSLRARTAWQASLDLTSYSEFGLIVIAVAVETGWLSGEWLAVAAVAVAVSFAVAAPVAERGDALFARHLTALMRLQRRRRLPGDEALRVRDVDVIVFGLGRMGSRAYAAVAEDFRDRVLGVDVDTGVVATQVSMGRHAVVGDATDPEFWSRAHGLIDRLQWVLLTMSSHEANVAAVERLRNRDFAGKIAATATFPDQARELERMGVDVTFDVYAEAGAGFANDLKNRFREK